MVDHASADRRTSIRNILPAFVAVLVIIGTFLWIERVQNQHAAGLLETERRDLLASERMDEFALIEAVRQGALPPESLRAIEPGGGLLFDLDDDGLIGDKVVVRFDVDGDGEPERLTDQELQDEFTRRRVDFGPALPSDEGYRQARSAALKGLDAARRGFERGLTAGVAERQLPLDALAVLQLDGSLDFDLDGNGEVTDDAVAVRFDFDDDGDVEALSEQEFRDLLNRTVG